MMKCKNCGNYDLEPVNNDYLRCTRCLKLILKSTEEVSEEPKELIEPSKEVKKKELDFEQMVRGLVRIKSSTGTGTGFILDDQGHVVTNAHVIGEDIIVHGHIGESPQLIELEMYADGRVMELDLALLKILDYEHDMAFDIAQTSPRLGETIYALGNPKNIGLSVSKGSISRIKPHELQLDITLNPGNSGGPVINREGEIVGVVSYLLQEVKGMAFAITKENLQAFLTQSIQSKEKENLNV